MDSALETAREAYRLAIAAVKEPAVARERVVRAVQVALAQVVFAGVKKGPHVYATGRVRVEGRGRITLGARCFFIGGVVPTSLIAHPGAELVVGESCGFNYGGLFEAHQSVRIGDRCIFASQVRVSDGGTHQNARPLIIGDDVWVAHGAILEPGITVGAGSVISAGSVVVKDVPPRSLAIGNPARCMPLSTVA